MRMVTYNLHNIVHVSVSGEDTDFMRYVQKELDGFAQKEYEANNQGKPSQEIRCCIGDLKAEGGEILSLGKGVFYASRNNTILLSRFHDTAAYRKNDIYASITNVYSEHRKTIEIKVDVNALLRGRAASRIVSVYRKLVKFDPRNSQQRLAESFFSQIVEPLLYRCFLDSGWVLLHSAALERGGEVVLVLGPQNIGKTSFTVEMAKRGWNMLGDDMCILNKDGEVLSHTKPLKIENEHLKRDTSFHKAVKISDSKIGRYLNPVYRRMVKRYGRFEFKASASELNIPIAERGKLRSILFLQRWNNRPSRDLPSVEKIPVDRAARLIAQHVAAEVDVNKKLDRDIRHMLALHDLGAESLTLLTDRAQSIINSATENKAAYILNMHIPDDNAVDRFEREISG